MFTSFFLFYNTIIINTKTLTEEKKVETSTVPVEEDDEKYPEEHNDKYSNLLEEEESDYVKNYNKRKWLEYNEHIRIGDHDTSIVFSFHDYYSHNKETSHSRPEDAVTQKFEKEMSELHDMIEHLMPHKRHRLIHFDPVKNEKQIVEALHCKSIRTTSCIHIIPPYDSTTTWESRSTPMYTKEIQGPITMDAKQKTEIIKFLRDIDTNTSDAWKYRHEAGLIDYGEEERLMKEEMKRDFDTDDVRHVAGHGSDSDEDGFGESDSDDDHHAGEL